MQCVSVYLCVFISSFVCRSVSLRGLIARQRTVHVPVRCLTTFELASELQDCSVCLGGLLVLFAPNFLQRPLAAAGRFWNPCTDLEALVWV